MHFAVCCLCPPPICHHVMQLSSLKYFGSISRHGNDKRTNSFFLHPSNQFEHSQCDGHIFQTFSKWTFGQRPFDTLQARPSAARPAIVFAVLDSFLGVPEGFEQRGEVWVEGPRGGHHLQQPWAGLRGETGRRKQRKWEKIPGPLLQRQHLRPQCPLLRKYKLTNKTQQKHNPNPHCHHQQHHRQSCPSHFNSG